MRSLVLFILALTCSCGSSGSPPAGADADADAGCPALPGPQPVQQVCPAGSCFLCNALDLPEGCPTQYCSSTQGNVPGQCTFACPVDAGEAGPSDAGAD